MKLSRLTPVQDGRDQIGWVSSDVLSFPLIGTLLLPPVILMYTTWSCWVLAKGKVQGDVGYP